MKPVARPASQTAARTAHGGAHAIPAQEPGSAAPGAANSPVQPMRPGVIVLPQARRARPRRRHLGLLLSFLLMVLVPAAVSGWYLFRIAADQFASTVSFSVRREDATSPIEFLGGLTGLTSSSSSDTDILFDYLHSVTLVAQVDARLGLRRIYAKPSHDSYFALGPDASIERLTRHWNRMNSVYYDPNTQLISVRVLAFDPVDAQRIAQAILDESSNTINAMTSIARADTMRFAGDELQKATARLTEARAALTAFRSRNQIVDPEADIQAQMGLLTQLQAQLADELINLDLLRDTTGDDDPRIVKARRRIEVMRSHIAEERAKFGTGQGGQDYPAVLADFERLSAERQFAEEAYKVALAAYDAAQAEARRQSRYLAAYLGPTLAETAEYPRRLQLTATVFAFAFLVWSILALVYYSVRDRR